MGSLFGLQLINIKNKSFFSSFYYTYGRCRFECCLSFLFECFVFFFAVVYLLAQQPAFSKLGMVKVFKFFAFCGMESEVAFLIRLVYCLQELRRS